MRTCKKKVLALLMALAMALSLLPTAALAAGSPLDNIDNVLDIRCDDFGSGILARNTLTLHVFYQEENGQIRFGKDFVYYVKNVTKTTLHVLAKPGYTIDRVIEQGWQNGSIEFDLGIDGLIGGSHPGVTIIVRAEDASATHTVTFDSGHGATEVSVPAGESLGENMPADPVYYNQKVNGWNTRADGKGFDITADTPITQDLTVYPQCSTTSLLSEYHIMGLERIQACTAAKLGVGAADVSVQQVQATDGKNTTTSLWGSNYYNSSADCWTALNSGSIVKPENLTGLVVTASVDGQTEQVTIPASEFASVTRYQYFAEIQL